MKEYLKACFCYKGRWNRQKFWLYPLAATLILLVPYMLLMFALGSGAQEEASGLLITIGMLIIPIYIALLYISIVSYVKRLRDLDKNPWMTVLIVVPFANIYLWVICGFFKGTAGSNQYGPDPLGNLSQEIHDDIKKETAEL